MIFASYYSANTVYYLHSLFPYVSAHTFHKEEKAKAESECAERDSKKGWCLITSCAANPFLFALTLRLSSPSPPVPNPHTHTRTPCARTYVVRRERETLYYYGWSGPTQGIPLEFPSCGQKGLKSLIMAFKCQRIINYFAS
jgi:hypothetical protein